jgi:mono/diheme cytochrome c family protein
MRDLPTSPALAWGVTAACLLASTSALALPWDIDMVDSQAVRGYECWEYTTTEDGVRTCIRAMQPLPDGVISQDHPFSPSPHKTRAPAKNDISAWVQMENPLQPTPQVLATGETMFRTYCAPCHGVPDSEGVIENLGTVAQPGRMAGVVALAGQGGVLSTRTDGQVYRVIRVGNAIMPAYNWAMSDDEMWSVVHYSRTLDNGVYVPPKPVDPADEGGSQ